MTDMLHHYSPPEQIDDPHHVTHERPSGEVVTDFHLAGDVLVFRSLADIDGILAALVAAKADHGAAEARAAAENDPRPAASAQRGATPEAGNASDPRLPDFHEPV